MRGVKGSGDGIWGQQVVKGKAGQPWVRGDRRVSGQIAGRCKNRETVGRRGETDRRMRGQQEGDGKESQQEGRETEE